jgi:SAM-dependent methyltransferase
VSYADELIRTGLRLPHKRAQGLLLRDLKTWTRIEFLGTALRTGVLGGLTRPRTARELASELGIAERGLLDSLLALGESLGELRRRGDTWELRGSRARALADPRVDGFAGLVEEATDLDAEVYRTLPARLDGGPRGDYLTPYAGVVARASRAAEPLLGPLVREIVHRYRPQRVLDVGCGTGIYLRHLAEASPTVTGSGIDQQADAVELARGNLHDWGVDGRFSVHEADVRRLPSDLTGPWDAVLLLQNIYYFEPAERPELLARLRALAPDGVVVVATWLAGEGDPVAAQLDLNLRSTTSCSPLPTVAEMRALLDGTELTTVHERRLAPGLALRAFITT